MITTDETNAGELSDTPGDESPKGDDIRVEYHPGSGRKPEIFSFEDFVRVAPDNTHPVGPDPWIPFRTREDFEFTELVLDAGMSKANINAMIDFVHKCAGNEKGRFTLSNCDEMYKILEVASERLPKVCLQTFLCVFHPR